MKTLYLIDATFELFRAYYSAPEKVNEDGQHIGATEGMLRNVENSIRRFDIEYAGLASDQIVESFRNKMFDGYKTGDGLPDELYSQFPLIEKGLVALGLTIWPMRKFEADDALATAAAKYAKNFDEIIIGSPDKDFYQCIDDKTFVHDIIRDKKYDQAELKKKLNITPASLPSYLGLVGDTADGIPGIPGFGAKTAGTLLEEFITLEKIPVAEDELELWPKVRGAAKLQATLRDNYEDALLYKELAVLRTDVPLKEKWQDLKVGKVDGAKWSRYCKKYGIKESITKRL